MRVGPRGSRQRVVPRFTAHLLSCPCRRVRNLSAAILSLLAQGSPWSALPDRGPSQTSDHHLASSPDRTVRASKHDLHIAVSTVAAALLRPHASPCFRTHLAFGSLRRLPARDSRGRPCDLAAARRPTGITSPGSSRVTSLPAISQTGSSMGTHPSEASPHSSPPDPLGSSCPPCRFPPCGAAAPRIRAVSGPFSPCGSMAPSNGCVH